MHYFLLTCRDHHLKHIKYRSHNAQNRRSSEISSCIFETYKNYVQPHGCNIYNTDEEMAMSTMCTYNSKHNRPPHWKHVLRCCDKFPSIVLPSQEENKDTTNTCQTMIFYVYRNVSRCNVNDQHTYHERTICSLCPTVPISDSNDKVYTRKEFVQLETSIT